MSSRTSHLGFLISVLLAATGCSGASQTEPITHPVPPTPTPMPRTATATTPVAPAAPDSFPLPDTALSAERDEDCIRAEARVKAGLALDGDFWGAMNCVVHQLAAPGTDDAYAKARDYVASVRAFRARHETDSFASVKVEDLPKPLSEDAKSAAAAPDTHVLVFALGVENQRKLPGFVEHLGSGGWRGICLPWSLDGHYQVTKKSAEAVGPEGYHLSDAAVLVLSDAAQDPDLFSWTNMAAHAQTNSGADGMPSEAPEAAQRRVVSFVHDHLAQAYKLCSGGTEDEITRALYWTGYAVHALQDLAPHRGRTNPEHSYNAASEQNPDAEQPSIDLAMDVTKRFFRYVLREGAPCKAAYAKYAGPQIDILYKHQKLGLVFDNGPGQLLEYRNSKALFAPVKDKNGARIRWFGPLGTVDGTTCDSGPCKTLLDEALK